MANVRRYMRFDVEVPFHLELVDSDRFQKNRWREMVSAQEEAQLSQLNKKIELQFASIFKTRSSAAKIFEALNYKLNYFSWMLTLMVQGENPHEKADYTFRLRENEKQLCPKISGDLKISALLENICIQLCDHIHEVQEAIAKGLEGKMILFTRKPRRLFDPADYVSNLHALAEKGFGQAVLLEALVIKLNFYENLLNRFKQAYQEVSDPKLWQRQKVNLSAGGFAFLTNQVFEKFAEMNVFMQLEGQILICRGKIVMNKQMTKGDYLFRMAIEFPFLDQEKSNFITLFVQRQEVRAAMAQAPL